MLLMHHTASAPGSDYDNVSSRRAPTRVDLLELRVVVGSHRGADPRCRLVEIVAKDERDARKLLVLEELPRRRGEEVAVRHSGRVECPVGGRVDGVEGQGAEAGEVVAAARGIEDWAGWTSSGYSSAAARAMRMLELEPATPTARPGGRLRRQRGVRRRKDARVADGSAEGRVLDSAVCDESVAQPRMLHLYHRRGEGDSQAVSWATTEAPPAD